ncbi:MAG: hypothetical protein KJ905_01995 [Nanoarchaeota archaeon]|nr:hypothetical protein [Nanoarchaeota archaeon]
MEDFFEELRYMEDYLNPKGKPAIVYVFSSDGRGVREFNRNFRARFAVSMPRNFPMDLIQKYGLQELYIGWKRLFEKESTENLGLRERASEFEIWLRDTSEEQIQQHLPVKIPLEELTQQNKDQ